VGRLRSNLQLALQPGNPALHQVQVVQEHPAALGNAPAKATNIVAYIVSSK
jgi:hypothetical protein